MKIGYVSLILNLSATLEVVLLFIFIKPGPGFSHTDRALLLLNMIVIFSVSGLYSVQYNNEKLKNFLSRSDIRALAVVLAPGALLWILIVITIYFYFTFHGKPASLRFDNGFIAGGGSFGPLQHYLTYTQHARKEIERFLKHQHSYGFCID